MNHSIFVAALLVAMSAWAGNIPNFAPCKKSNDCRSVQCTKNRCEPSVQWNGHETDGSYCESNSNCVSRNCRNRKCEPQKEKEVEKPKDKAKDKEPEKDPEPSRSPRGGGEGSSRKEKTDDLPPVSLDACAKDLRKTVYDDDVDPMFARENDQLAADICARYDATTIAKAKALMKGGYGIGFTDTLREVEKKSDEEIACGKKAFDALPKDAREVPFKIPVRCFGTQTPAEVDTCVKDLGGLKVPAATAKNVCTTYGSDTIAKAKKIVKAGYKHEFDVLCRNIDYLTDAEIKCAKKYLDDLFPDDPDGYEYRVPEECVVPLKQR